MNVRLPQPRNHRRLYSFTTDAKQDGPVACELRIEARRWLGALFAAALALAQVLGSAHAPHSRAAGPHHPCLSSTQGADVALKVSDQRQGTPPLQSQKQLCCQAICVMAAVQLAGPLVPVPTGLTAPMMRPADHRAVDGFPDGLDRPPKAPAIG